MISTGKLTGEQFSLAHKLKELKYFKWNWNERNGTSTACKWRL